MDRIGTKELTAAAALARTAAANGSMRPDVEHLLFLELWNHISRALDVADFDPAYQDEVDALEAEMAGRVLSFRLARGWLVRAHDAPTEFPSFHDAIAIAG